jgi:hypothetical protein
LGNDGRSPTVSRESASLGGVIRFAGVVVTEDSVEDCNSGLPPGG